MNTYMKEFVRHYEEIQASQPQYMVASQSHHQLGLQPRQARSMQRPYHLVMDYSSIPPPQPLHQVKHKWNPRVEANKLAASNTEGLFP